MLAAPTSPHSDRVGPHRTSRPRTSTSSRLADTHGSIARFRGAADTLHAPPCHQSDGRGHARARARRLSIDVPTLRAR
eukprot:3450531-Prymnesium_polylepis.1